MRIFLIVVSFAAALWGGYWLVVSQIVQRGALALLADIDADPTVSAGTAGLRVGGFPARFDLTVTEPELRSNPDGFSWQAPGFRLVVPSYRPNHITAIWPDSQRLNIDGETFELTSTDMRSEVFFRLGWGLPLDRLRFRLSDLRLLGPLGDVGIGAALITTSRADAAGREHDLAADISSILPDAGWLGALPPATPSVIEGLVLDARLDFDEPIALMGDPQAQPALVGLDLREASLEWGPMTVRIVGSFTAGRAGLWNGRATLTARNWEQMLDIAIAAGWIEAGPAGFLRGGLATLDRDGELSAPIELREGVIRFAGIPISRPPATGGF